MSRNRADMKMFVNKCCYNPLFTAVNRIIASQPTVLNSRYTSVGYPDTAFLQSLLIESVQNVTTVDDTVNFDLVVSCEAITETENACGNTITKEVKGWLRVKCVAVITDQLDSFEVLQVTSYARDQFTKNDGIETSETLVPIIRKEQYEDEAIAFLERYCKDALNEPMPVPIRRIIEEQMGLTVLSNYCLSRDLSYLGEICFSKGTVRVWDMFQQYPSDYAVERGTVLIDSLVPLQYNMGCLNNTMAHEAFHWHRHRLYASIKNLLSDAPVVSHRCPRKEFSESDNLTDEQWMEIQANALAPRILMPRDMFKKKTDELFKQYNYDDSPLKLAILKCIAEDVSSFFQVSYSSALIRLIEVGYNDFKALKQAEQDPENVSYLNVYQAYYAYETSAELRKLIDEGLFIWADGYYVVNDPDYVSRGLDGAAHLTQNAWNDIEKCALRFSKKTLSSIPSSLSSCHLFHRAGGINQKVAQYQSDSNLDVVLLSDELRKFRDLFEEQEKGYNLYQRGMSCWQYINAIIESKGLTKKDFVEATWLNDKVYTRARENYKSSPEKMTIMAIVCGLNLDISTAEELMRLAGHSFSESQEDRALRFCITTLSGKSMYEKNDFLIELGVKPLGSRNYQ